MSDLKSFALNHRSFEIWSWSWNTICRRGCISHRGITCYTHLFVSISWICSNQFVLNMAGLVTLNTNKVLGRGRPPHHLLNRTLAKRYKNSKKRKSRALVSWIALTNTTATKAGKATQVFLLCTWPYSFCEGPPGKCSGINARALTFNAEVGHWQSNQIIILHA